MCQDPIIKQRATRLTNGLKKSERKSDGLCLEISHGIRVKSVLHSLLNGKRKCGSLISAIKATLERNIARLIKRGCEKQREALKSILALGRKLVPLRVEKKVGGGLRIGTLYSLDTALIERLNIKSGLMLLNTATATSVRLLMLIVCGIWSRITSYLQQNIQNSATWSRMASRFADFITQKVAERKNASHLSLSVY